MQVDALEAAPTQPQKKPMAWAAFGVPSTWTVYVPAPDGMLSATLCVVGSTVPDPTSASPKVTATCKDVNAAGACASVNVSTSAAAVDSVKEYSTGAATLAVPTRFV